VEGRTDDNEQGRIGEDGTPVHAPHSVLDVVDASGRAAEQEEFDVVDRQRDILDEVRGRSCETLQGDVGEEEGRGSGQVGGKGSGDGTRVRSDVLERVNDTRGEGDNKETVLYRTRRRRVSQRPTRPMENELVKEILTKTRKIKYRVMSDSSTAVLVGVPSNRDRTTKEQSQSIVSAVRRW
jgi:hypothetical protein